MDTATLYWGLLFGSIGLGFFVYGKRQQAFVPLLCGLALMVVPYFVANTLAWISHGAINLADVGANLTLICIP